MKIARVIPLFKSGDHSNPDNYRPISLLPVISKVLEKLVYNKVVEHLDENNIVYHRQYGFRRRHSTSDASLNLVGDILRSYESNHMVLAIFVDLRKVFDTVSHSIVLRKLNKLGVGGIEYDWCCSYLSQHTQMVDINDSQSDYTYVTTGIPQGSLLGVLLFQLHINDIYRCLKFSTSILYADDTTIYVSRSSLRFIKLKLEKDLETLSGWLRLNLLKLNVMKTKCMLFHREGLARDIMIEVEGERIEVVNNFCFLGLNLDSSLQFETHYNVVYGKLLKSAYVLRSLGGLFPTDCMKPLYFAYYHSHLTYCMLTWFPLLKKKFHDSLYALQKRVVQAINRVSYKTHCIPLFKKDSILTLDDQITLECCKLMYHVYNDLCSKPICHFFKRFAENAHHTRNANLFVEKMQLLIKASCVDQ